LEFTIGSPSSYTTQKNAYSLFRKKNILHATIQNVFINLMENMRTMIQAREPEAPNWGPDNIHSRAYLVTSENLDMAHSTPQLHLGH